MSNRRGWRVWTYHRLHGWQDHTGLFAFDVKERARDLLGHLRIVLPASFYVTMRCDGWVPTKPPALVEWGYHGTGW